MAIIADHSNIELVLGKNLTDASADVLVLTQSNGGHLNGPYQAVAERYGFYPEKDTALGEIDPRGILNSESPYKYLIYAAAYSTNGSSYRAVRSIGVKLAEFANQNIDVNTVACGVIGSGSGELNGIECVRILSKSFLEVSNKKLNIYTNDQAVYDAVEQFDIKEYNSNNSNKFAFNASVKRTYTQVDIAPIISLSDFYYNLASKKFEEYIIFNNDQKNFFEELLTQFKSRWSAGFINTLNQFADERPQYEFLKICGELLAYIDKNAANKHEWNQYSDKRFIAKSHVNQFDWIANLILFRAKNDFSGVALNVSNAIKFLQEPETRLCMLSERHRGFLLKNIYGSIYSNEEDLEIVFKQFRLWGIYPSNPINTGALITRILYLDEIEKLWNFDPDTQKPVYNSLFPGELEEVEHDGPPQASNQTIESTFLTDYYAETDQLNYELYATAIVAFINHKNTRPPLTIGIMAPWGKGKTSLMRFIKKKFDAFPSINPKDKSSDGTVTLQSKATFRIFKYWLDKIKDKFRYERTLQYPTVWFNAWKFQKNEQIWAGFAYEIIHQLVEQLPDELTKEEFWLRMNLKRIDQEKLRNKILFKVVNKTISAIGVAVIVLIGLITSIFGHWAVWVDFITCGLLPVGSIIYWYKIHEKVSNEKIDFDIEKFIKQPDYASKRGYFHEVEDDLRDVMNLLVAEDKPAVIFIDDLDRCSPNTVAEVVEAINLFISGDFPKCYFILGQDAQMVAASLDVAYDKFGDKTTDLYREQGSLGWHFMEKFVQLQFCIPVLNDEQAKTFFKNFFRSKPTTLELEENSELKEQVEKLEKRIDSGEKIADLLTAETRELEEDLKAADPLKAVQLQEKIIETAASQYDDQNPDVLQLIEQLSTYIGSSPRSIKRFINLYRFYKFLQLTNRNVRLQETTSVHLGQWIVVMIRWPQLVRAIQWHTDGDFIKGATPSERAKGFEKFIHQYANYNEWTDVIENVAPKLVWLKDVELYQYMKFLKKDKNSLENAVKMGVW